MRSALSWSCMHRRHDVNLVTGEADPDRFAAGRGGIDRASSADLAQLAFDHGCCPMHVAGILVLGGRPAGMPEVRAAIRDRIGGIPRFRQHLARTPLGCGRPVWVADRDFDIHDHVQHRSCPSPGDERALLDLAASLATTRLPRDRSPWRVTLVTGLENGGAALVFVLHHVLADGIGGLAVLGQLADGARPVRPVPPSRPPRPRALFVDAVRERLTVLAGIRKALRTVREAAVVIGSARSGAPRCSLNRPTGPNRVLTVARTDLATLHDVAHQHGATVNDAVLTVTTGALHTLLRHRGEHVERLALAMPVSARRSTTVTRLGNQVIPSLAVVPVAGDPFGRLAETARITRARKAAPSDGPPALVELAFRATSALGVMAPYIRRQRITNTSVTDLHGPDARLSFLGTPVTDVIPITSTTGNMTVVFVALSYAHRMTITAVADRDACPDVEILGDALRGELAALTRVLPAAS